MSYPLNEKIEKMINEKRVSSNNLEFRVVGEDDEKGELKIEGLAIPYEVMTELGFGTSETIKKGACKKSLEKNDQTLLWQHDTTLLLASRLNNSLELEEKDDGVFFRASILKEDRVFYDKVKTGMVNKMSCGFWIDKRETTYSELDDSFHIDIIEMRLFEISVVSHPAYESTEVVARGIRECLKEKSDLQERAKSNSIDIDLLFGKIE